MKIKYMPLQYRNGPGADRCRGILSTCWFVLGLSFIPVVYAGKVEMSSRSHLLAQSQ